MNKTKLLVFHPALAPYRIDFFNGLNRYFNAKFFFSLDNVKDQKFNQEKLLNLINFSFNLLNRGFELKNRSIRFGIWKILKNENPEIVFCSEYSQITLSVIFYKHFVNPRLKVFIMSDDSIDLSIKRKGLRKYIRNISSKYITGIIFPSNRICNWYKENITSKPKTLELPIVHDNEIFRNMLFEALPISENYIKEYGLQGKKIFLFVGRLVALKNLDFLIKSFSESKTKNEKLIIVGEGVEYIKLLNLVKELKLEQFCVFTGRLEGEKLLAWYNIAQCFILPSYKERFGAVVNEALLAGCKVLCSNLAGASELINTMNGHIFDPKDKIIFTNLLKETGSEIIKIELPIKLKPDLMPFTLNEKIDRLILNL